MGQKMGRNGNIQALVHLGVALVVAVGVASITPVAHAKSPHDARVSELVYAWPETRGAVTAGNSPSLTNDTARPPRDGSAQELLGFGLIGMGALALTFGIALAVMRTYGPSAGASPRAGADHPLVTALGRLYTRY